MLLSALIAALATTAATTITKVDDMPVNVVKDITYAAEICRALGQKFKFDKDYVELNDFNGDGVQDYIIDVRGFFCNKKEDSLFGGPSGKPLYVYVSTPEKDWRKVYNSYVFEYRVKKQYGELPLLDVWVRGDVGYKVNMQRYQWDGERMELFDQKIGVEVPTQLWKSFD
jgi:hypothetical protein